MTPSNRRAPAAPERAMVAWIPDWPIHAQRLEHEAEQRLSPQESPAGPSPRREPTASRPASFDDVSVALVSTQRIMACSPLARSFGIRIGMREREARQLCPDIALFPHHPETDARRFAPVLAAVERIMPGAQEIRPGLCALRARGPARYYGSELAAARALLELLAAQGFPDARIGIADGRFAAMQAARASSTIAGVDVPETGVRVVPPQHSPAFLSALPISRAAAPDLSDVLIGLGIRTLGAFAELPEESVRQRFGEQGVEAHRLARVQNAAFELAPLAVAPREILLTLDFEPPLDSADQLAFASSSATERFITDLLDETLVCTEVRVEIIDDIGVRYERTWAHPGRFTAADLVNRIRWQAGGLKRDTERAGAGIVALRVSPERVERTALHEPGLWSSEPDERVHHHITRLQSLVGHDGALIGSLTGGRLSADRQRFAAWGTRPSATPHRSAAAGPWPGAAVASGMPAPTRVFPVPIPADLLDASARTVTIDSEDLLSSAPAALRVDGYGPPRRVVSWSAPWPVRERWWDAAAERVRLQILLDDGTAWLLHRTGATQHGPRPRPPEAASSRGTPATATATAQPEPLPPPTDGHDPAWFAEGRYD